MRLLASLQVLLLVTGCATTREPEVPRTITQVVERYKPLPGWATRQLTKPEPADGSVRARVQSHERRGYTIDLANCHRRLLARLDAGADVDARECEALLEPSLVVPPT